MVNLLLALAFVIALFYGYRTVAKLDRFLDSGKIESEDTDESSSTRNHRETPFDASSRD